jgi:hypothetical protein
MINSDKLESGNAAISKFMERSHVFNYHESWNLLMPVIEKITVQQFRAALYFNQESAAANIYDPLNRLIEIQTHGPRESSIMTVWKGVVDFLERTQTGSND